MVDESIDHFNTNTGEIIRQTSHKVIRSKVEPTDEFIKVSKYLNVIFAYNGIPLSMVPFSLVIAQRMEFKTNILYLLKDDKEQIAEMLGVSVERVRTLIKDAKKYDIIRSVARSKYEVNSFLFSTGDMIETRNLQAHFDFDHDQYSAIADQTNLITGKSVHKAVVDAKAKGQIPGQISLSDYSLGDKGGAHEQA